MIDGKSRIVIYGFGRQRKLKCVHACEKYRSCNCAFHLRSRLRTGAGNRVALRLPGDNVQRGV
jgi:hypothetical protein